MKLFNEDFRFTPEANDAYGDLREALEVAYRIWLARGASPRDLALLANHAAIDLECEFILLAQSHNKTVKEYLTEN